MSPLSLFFAFSLDLLVGDPVGLPHPVKVIGKAVAGLEAALYAPDRKPAHKVAAGAVLVAAVALTVFFATHWAVSLAYRFLGPSGGAAVTVCLAYTTISVKGLARAANDVVSPLEKGEVRAAREALSRVVGRDTAGLDAGEVARGAVETVAENTSDGIVAPLLYLALGGAPLAMAYKAVNTMDSMIGYRSERYRDFGRAAARLDDLANLIPARLTGLLMVMAAWAISLAGGRHSWKGAWKIFLRDRKKHPSPNSGHPEAAAAGALRVRLGGASSYGGAVSVKPWIGDPDEPLSPGKIRDAVRLMYATSVFSLLLSAFVAYLV